jgi:abhydrolase domain-containing protein 5
VPCTINNQSVGPTPDESMHSISSGSKGPAVVCMPGYAAGAAFFYRNLKGLASHSQVFLLDWLGTGLSGRPPFQCQTRVETEQWFVDSLERWREAQGIASMVLVGHSLGGYLSANYALKHPERVLHLVLVNPAGMVRLVMATGHNTTAILLPLVESRPKLL